MEIEDPITREFNVKFIKKTIVKANCLLPEPHILHLSNLDLLSGRFPVTYFYVYRNVPNNNFTSIIKALEISLANTLNHYYPFSGQIVLNPKTSEPEIICDNHGALIVQSYVDIPLSRLDYYNLNGSLEGKLVSSECDIPLHVQVTNYACGGISITFTFDHALGDASALGNFLRSWSEVARGMPISCVPDHQRYLQARSPPSYDPSLDHTFITCNMDEILNMPANDISLKRLYHIDASNIDRLQRVCNKDGKKRTKIEAFSAYVWKIMATTIGESNTRCMMGWLVDGRRRMCKEKNSMSNYIGNVLSVSVQEASVEELKHGTMSDVARMVHDAIAKVTNEAHFLDLIDWVECHRPGLMLAKIVLGRAGPALVVSSAGQFPVAELDFGFGPPILGTVCSTISKIGTGYMNQRPSAKGDGSWVVSTIIWPALAAALESDPDHVFQPMTASHLGLS